MPDGAAGSKDGTKDMTHVPFRIQEILFPTDFSKSTEAAALHVAGLAHALGAKVSLLNVVPWLSGWHGVSEPYFIVGDDVLRKLDLVQKATETSCLKTLENVTQQFFQDVECNFCVRTGGVAETVIDYAQEIQADLIMMPTRGFGLTRPFLIGSATAKVLHDATCAVWTSPHPRELEPFRPYRQIVCAMNYSSLSRDLLVKALQVARLFKSRLSLVTAIPSPASETHLKRESVQLLTKETVYVLRHLLEELKLDMPFHVLEGSTGQVIRQVATTEDADLVVIGRGHLDQKMGHLRTHAYEIICDSPCPVLSL
jgi:nucleotide-binding universal stress UspA family protein